MFPFSEWFCSLSRTGKALVDDFGLTLQTRWRENALKREKFKFRLPSVAQKRLCLNSLLSQSGSPYPGIPVEKLFDLLKSGYRMQKPQNCPSDIYDMMLNCWDENPTNRASFTDLRKQFDAMLSSMTSKDYLEILAQSIEDIAREMETPITDDSDMNNDAITESSC